MRDVAALVATIMAPGIHVGATDARSRSHFGGAPRLPKGVSWPENNGRKLDFLARISLQELHKALSLPWLPDSGALLFFYDAEGQPWGFDPKHRGGAAVLLVPDRATKLEQPDEVEDFLPHQNVEFRRKETLPSFERSCVKALALSLDESDDFDTLEEAEFEESPRHQIAGFPRPVQGDDMEVECQLVSNGIYCGDGNAYEDEATLELRSGATDWRLLLQFDTDDDLNVMWGDCGTLYFWVREQEARDGNFSNAWAILQCS
jgi:uncharacterized protein YwqG